MSFCAVVATMMLSIVSAHGAWFAQRCDRLQLVVGEGWKDNGSVNVIGCEMVVPYENKGIDKKATRSKVFVSLSYTIYPPEDE